MQNKPFEALVRDHVDRGSDIHTAFGKAIDEDPEAYGRYLKQQKQTLEEETT
ncbi:MAG: hypothetical protein NTW71_13010 [Deltaproteobacteria bacterium]|nr:hypothetical protein [Deltaproteobacteria bacterium]